MAKSRRSTRSKITLNPIPQSQNDTNESELNNSENTATKNVIDDDYDGEEPDLDIPDHDDGDDYQPDGDGDGDAEDVSLNNDEESDSKIKTEVAEEDDDEDDNSNNDENHDVEGEEEEEEDNDDHENDKNDDANEENDSSKTESSGQKRKAPTTSRRHKQSNLNAVNKKRQQSTPVAAEEETTDGSFPVENDEYVTPDDSKGERKITKLGYLLGGRQFRVKTFKVPGRGDRLYAISTDVARLVGYRDSYFLFQKHLHLFRVRIDEESKMSLINDDLLPGTFKTRAAYLVTARSAFKEFGARIVANGRQVLDDYYEDKAREEGAIEGAIINPVLSSDGYASSVVDSTTLFERQKNIALLLSNNNILETETSWVYDHALKCRQFDSMMFYDRNELLKKYVLRDIYTNLNFVPDITQPTRVSFKKLNDVNDSKRKITFDTVIGGSTVVNTGLSNVSPEIFEGCVSEDIKQAILQQQEYEKSL